MDKAGLKVSSEDLVKLKELISKLKSAKGEERAHALADVKNIHSISKSSPLLSTYWPETIVR